MNEEVLPVVIKPGCGPVGCVRAPQVAIIAKWRICSAWAPQGFYVLKVLSKPCKIDSLKSNQMLFCLHRLYEEQKNTQLYIYIYKTFFPH